VLSKDNQTSPSKLIEVTTDACSKSAATGWMLLKTTSGEVPVAIDQKVAA
jgi:hypothetical protein